MKIVIRMPNWVGDFVMATPILEEVRSAYPEAKIFALCGGVLGELLEKNPYVDEVIGFSRKRRFFPKGLISRLRREKFDLGILLTSSFSSAWHFWIGGVKKRIRFKRRLWDLPQQHLVLSYKQLIGSESTSVPQLFIAPKEKKIGKTLIGINPGAAYGSAKCWPPERFRAVIERLLAEIPNVEISVFGDQGTKSVVDSICEGLEVRNLAGKTTLKELIAEIGRLDAFLTNDSGPMHIAAALKVPLVALFGSTNPYATGPYGSGKVLYKKASCSPCYKRTCPIDFRCMRAIEVEETVQELKRALLIPALKQKQEPFSFVGATEPAYVRELPSSRKTVGVIILAAGKGRRLGLFGPKGCVEVGGKSLYEILLSKIGGRCAIMTSPATHADTQRHLEERGFGYVDLFQERCLPRLSDVYDESPEGNGAVFSTFYGSPLWETWGDIDEICVMPIDNPLAEVIVGDGAELTVLAVEKESIEEKLGVLVDKGGRLYVCEYTQKPPGKLGYSGIFSCSKEFFERAAKAELPWHRVGRDGIEHFERYVFDAFPLANSVQILLKGRKGVFAPIKTREDLVQYL